MLFLYFSSVKEKEAQRSLAAMSNTVQEVPAMAEALDLAADSPPAKVEAIDHAEAIEVSAQVASKRQRISDLFTIVSYNSFVHV